MIRRTLPAFCILLLAACQPYYGYPPYSSSNGLPDQASDVPVGVPVWASPASSANSGAAQRSVRLAAAGDMAFVASPVPAVAAPSDVADDAFHEIDVRGGDVSFPDADPVLKREVGNYPDRYVERITLENNGLFVYEMLTSGNFAAVSDADLIKTDLKLPSFRRRGIVFDPAKLERIGPFTYLAQSSSTDNCFIFRGRFRHAAGDASRLNEAAYGNVCYPAQSKDLASVKAEMVDLLASVRFGSGAGTTLVTTVSAAAPAKPATSAALVAAASGPMTLGHCGYSVSFSGAAAHATMEGDPSTERADYGDEKSGYSETATCTCKPDFDYASISQFDAVDNVRRHAAESGFTLQKASFGEPLDHGKALYYEAVSKRPGGEAFLIGRTVYGHCSLSVAASGTSYADLVRAKTFLASLAARKEETAATAPPEPLVSNATITAAAPAEGRGAEATAPTAVPTTPVAAADLTHPAAAATEKMPSAKAEKPPVALVASDPPAPATVVSAKAQGPAVSDGTAERLRRLKLLLDQKLITPDEYEAKRKAVLDTL